tara:strand:- start:151 stop:561 length:411 start_codon:yes stop_codon:yes gene_type:complete
MTLFDWLKELTGKKRDWDSFSDKERESFNPYMINRFLSMHKPFIELVNYVQTIPYTNKKKYYTVYCGLLPKQNVWLKYIKSTMRQPTTELVTAIAEIMECSRREAANAVMVLDNDHLEEVLYKAGYQSSEVAKMFK